MLWARQVAGCFVEVSAPELDYRVERQRDGRKWEGGHSSLFGAKGF
jgi:hypothetical protein